MDTFRDAPARPEPRHLQLGLGSQLRWRVGCLLADGAMLALAGVATAIGSTAAGVGSVSAGWTLAYCALVLGLLAARGLYGVGFGVRTFDDLRLVVGATSLAAVSLLAFAALAGAGSDAIDQSLRLWLYSTAYLAAGRTAIYWSRRRERSAGEGLRPTLIVGAGRVGRLAAQRLTQMPHLGLKPIGYLDKEPRADEGNGPVLPVLGASWDLEQVVREHEVEQVIITFSTAPDDVLLRLVRRCEELGVAVAVVPRLYERTTTRISVDHVGGLPLVSAHPSDPHGLNYAIKYTVDRLVALGLVVLLSPVLLGAAVATYLSVGRPIFFRQPRIGRDGVEFDMVKFRTMHAPRGRSSRSSSERALRPAASRAATGGARSAASCAGARSTSCRSSSTSSLGRMSIVGPRPERTQYVRQFEGNVYRYGERHRVKSGSPAGRR